MSAMSLQRSHEPQPMDMPCPGCGGTVLCNGPNEYCSSCNWRNRYDV